MGERFRGLGDAKDGDRDEWVEGLGERYGMGDINGWDGIRRLGIDFDEFVDRN